MYRNLSVLLLTWTILVVGTLGGSIPATAQGRLGPDPMITYYQALQAYRDGDIENAMRGFEMAERGTRTDLSGKWIDAVPARVMLAECYWQLGHLPACRANLDAATAIAVHSRGWIPRLNFSSLNSASQVAAPGNLWPEVASVQLLAVPNRIPLLVGQQITEQALAAGGVMMPPNIKSIDAVEIMRCLAIASYRRRVLLGPLAADDASGSELLEATKRPTGLNHPLAESLLNTMRGCEYYSTGEDKTAVDRASKFASPGGVHPLTPISMLCALTITASGDDRGALNADARGGIVNTARQLVNAAAALEQYEWIGDTLQIAVGVASDVQLNQVEQTALVAGRVLVQRSRMASLHCYLVAADAAVSAGRVGPATEHLQTALALTSRRDIQLPRLQAYSAYLAARIAAKNGQSIDAVTGGDMAAALSTLNDFVLYGGNPRRPVPSMPFRYQADLVMSSLSGNVGNQSAKRILNSYANANIAVLWRQDPIDALAAINFDDSALHASLLRMAALENDGLEVLRQTDRLLAKRFTTQLPLQGRLLQLQTLASSPADSLWPSVQEYMKKPVPALARLVELTQASLVVPAAAGQPGAAAGQPGAAAGQPGAAAGQPGAAAGAEEPVRVRSGGDAVVMEAMLSDLALSRIDVPEINPPRIATTDVVEIPDGTALLTFAIDSGRLLASASRDGTTRTWVVPGASRLPAMVSRLLQDIGAAQSRGKRLPDDDVQWRSTATKIRNHLLPAESGWSEEGLKKIIVVPDGPLWYLPFELLPADSIAKNGDRARDASESDGVESDDEGDGSDPASDGDPDHSSLWADAVELQYAPTPGFALRHVAAASSSDRVAMIAGNFFAVRDPEVNASIVRDIMQTAENAFVTTVATAPPTDRIGLDIGHLIVAEAVKPNFNTPLSTQLVPVGNSAGGDGNSLRAWVRYPAGGPKTVFLGGLRTSAETGKLGDGNELFFPMISLQASGVHDVGMSRWATGGASAATVMSEVVNEIPYTSLAAAIRRGTVMLRQTELSISREPLLGKADSEATNISGGEPLFWATYLSSGSLELPPPAKED